MNVYCLISETQTVFNDPILSEIAGEVVQIRLSPENIRSRNGSLLEVRVVFEKRRKHFWVHFRHLRFSGEYKKERSLFFDFVRKFNQNV